MCFIKSNYHEDWRTRFQIYSFSPCWKSRREAPGIWDLDLIRKAQVNMKYAQPKGATR